MTRFALFLLLMLSMPASAGLMVERLHSLRADVEQPSDVAISADGRAYLLDGVNGRIVVFDAAGGVDFVIRPEADAAMKLPMGIAISDGQLYIADSGNHRLLLLDLDGRLIRAIPLQAEQPPEPVSLVADEGYVYWSDRRNHKLCRTDTRKGDQTVCWGGQGDARGEFHFPFQLALDAEGYLHVVDILNGRLQQFNRNGRFVTETGFLGLGAGALYRPNGLAVNRDGILLVSDAWNGNTSLFERGRFVDLLRDADGAALQFRTPVGLTLFRDRLYVVDMPAGLVDVFRLYPAKAESAAQRISERAVGPKKNCISCHLSWASGYQPETIDPVQVPPVASERMCYSCHHGAVIDSRSAIGRGEQHPNQHHRRKQEKESTQDRIPDDFTLIDASGGPRLRLYCGSCHTPHNIEAEAAVRRDPSYQNPWLRVLDHDGDLCQRCHESKTNPAPEIEPSVRGANHPLAIRLKAPPATESRGYAKDEHLQRGLPQQLMDRGALLGSRQQMICQSCHIVHGAEAESLLPMNNEQSGMCEVCHQRHAANDLEEARRKGVHPVNIELDEPVKMGDVEINKVTCLTCHTAHEGVEGTPSLRFDHRDGVLCSYCHDGYDAVANSDHDLRVTARESRNRFQELPQQNGVCGSCHTLHRGNGEMPFLYAAQGRPYQGAEHTTQRDRLCLGCHAKEGVAEGSLVEHFSHPKADLILRSDPETMPLLAKEGAIAEFGEIVCITCHDPHRWSADEDARQTEPGGPQNQTGNVTNSFLRHRDLKGTFCVECHGLETRPKYKYFHDEVVRDIGVDYIK